MQIRGKLGYLKKKKRSNDIKATLIGDKSPKVLKHFKDSLENSNAIQMTSKNIMM